MAIQDSTVTLDGSAGEGGGQILRSALSLSLITGRPFRIDRLRANRTPGGLRPQHLACVRGAELVSGGTSEGAEVGSASLSFTPGKIRPGTYLLEIGTAGSAPLLFQCLFYPLALAGPSELTLLGGTHVPHSPSYHDLVGGWVPVVESFGFRAQLSMRAAGFYPEGGGEIRAKILPRAEPPTLLELLSRGTLRDVEATSFVSGLPFEVGERQVKEVVAGLRELGIYCTAERLPMPAPRSSGSAIFIRIHFENSIACFVSIGERGEDPIEAARRIADKVGAFMASTGAVDQHLSDQLILPAALLAAGLLGPSSPGTTRFAAERITSHLETHAQVIERFLPVSVRLRPDGEVQVGPAR